MGAARAPNEQLVRQTPTPGHMGGTMRTELTTWRWTVLLAGGVGILLMLPALWSGFVISDLGPLPVLERWYPEVGAPFNVYASFFDLPGFPWWIGPETQMRFYRPLSSALLHLDHRLFAHRPLGYHVHSLLWLGGFLALSGVLYSRLPRGVGTVALAIVAFDEAHIVSSGWICGRHAVVAVVLSLLGLLAHLRWREQGWWPGLPLSLAGLAGGLLAGETALSVIAFVVCWELFAFRPESGRPALGQRLVGLLPVGLLAAGYLLLYRAMGYGASGMGYYLNPGGDPIRLLSGLAVRIPPLLAAGLLNLPAFLWDLLPDYRWLQILFGIAAVPAVAALAWRWRRELEPSVARELRWLIPGSLAALIPAAFAPPSERQMLVPILGLAVVLAFLLCTGWRRWRSRDRQRSQRLPAGLLVLLLAVAHFGGPIAVRVFGFTVVPSWTSFYAEMADQLPFDSARGDRQQMIAVNTPGDLTYFAQYVDLVRDGPRFAGRWHVLSAAPHDLRLERTAGRTLELEVVGGQLLGTDEERAFLPPGRRWVAGEVIETALFRVEVLAADDLGPTRIAFHFRRDLEDPDLTFVIWHEDRFEEISPPAMGESLAVPWSPEV